MSNYDIICDTVVDMLEETAFVFSDPVDDSTVTEEEQKNMLGYIIRYDNDKKGTLSVRAHKDVAISITANMMGIEEDDPVASDNAGEGLKEFTNILAGNVITALYGRGPIINLSLPEQTDTILTNGDDNTYVEVEVDESKLIVAFYEEN